MTRRMWFEDYLASVRGNFREFVAIGIIKETQASELRFGLLFE
jgi:hypothetical protein